MDSSLVTHFISSQVTFFNLLVDRRKCTFGQRPYSSCMVPNSMPGFKYIADFRIGSRLQLSPRQEITCKTMYGLICTMPHGTTLRSVSSAASRWHRNHPSSTGHSMSARTMSVDGVAIHISSLLVLNCGPMFVVAATFVWLYIVQPFNMSELNVASRLEKMYA